MPFSIKTLMHFAALPILVLAEHDMIQQQLIEAPKLITLPTTTHLLRSSESSNKDAANFKYEPSSGVATNTLRLLQRNSTAQQIDNSAAAYLKCYSLMDDATTASNGIMTQTEYLSFLMLMTDGMINYSEFADVSALYVMIFYVAACTNSDCAPDNVPQIEIGDTNDPNDTIQFMCQQTLKSITSTAETIFEYTIRYSTSMIEEEDLATCLSTATVNVLLNDLANCPPLTDVNVDSTRRRKTRRKVEVQRNEQALGSAMTDENSMCDYHIVSSVERFTELRML